MFWLPLRPCSIEWGSTSPANFLVVAERGLGLPLGPADDALELDLDGDEVVGVHVVELDVAVLQGQLELPGVGALDRLAADELERAALFLVVDELAVEDRVLDDALELVFAERFGIFLALPRLDLPARLAVVGGHAGHALEGELLAHEVGALVLLEDLRLEAAAPVNLPVRVSVLTASIFSMPPMVLMYFATISSAVGAGAGAWAKASGAASSARKASEPLRRSIDPPPSEMETRPERGVRGLTTERGRLWAHGPP